MQVLRNSLHRGAIKKGIKTPYLVLGGTNPSVAIKASGTTLTSYTVSKEIAKGSRAIFEKVKMKTTSANTSSQRKESKLT